MTTGVCKHCGYPIKRVAESGLHPWVHNDGIAVCPTATYAAPELS